LHPTLDENKTKSDRERMREVDRECNETLIKVEKGLKKGSIYFMIKFLLNI
jgi:hypothetical protein